MNNKYKKLYCDELINYMSKGYSFESFASVANCSIRTLHNWKKVNESFEEAYQVGHAKRLAFLETCMLMKITGKSSELIDSRRINWKAVEFSLKTLYSPIYSTKEESIQERIVEPSAEDIDFAELTQSYLSPEQKKDLREKLKASIRSKLNFK